MKTFIDRIRAWRHMDAVIDSARGAEEDYQQLLDKYHKLAIAAQKVVASRNKPVGWPALQADIMRLELTLYGR